MNHTEIMDSASRIKLERQKRSWTQEQLAERAKLSTRTVQRLECGAEASPETLRLLAEAFGVSADALRSSATRMHFRAPWSRSIWLISAATLVLAVVVLVSIRITWVHQVTWVALIACGLLSVSGYSVKDGQLLIHRLGWAMTIDLADLTAFQANPHAMMGSLRLFGNGGIFCFIGYYRNSVIGKFRPYVTDSSRAVVLEFGERKIVVSPDDPQAFVETLHEATKGVRQGDEPDAAPRAR